MVKVSASQHYKRSQTMIPNWYLSTCCVQKVESRLIYLSCENLFQMWAKINMFKSNQITFPWYQTVDYYISCKELKVLHMWNSSSRLMECNEDFSYMHFCPGVQINAWKGTIGSSAITPRVYVKFPNSPLWVWIPPGTLDSFMWGSYSLANDMSVILLMPVKIGKSPYDNLSVLVWLKTQ